MSDDLLTTVKKALAELDASAKADDLGRNITASRHVEANDVHWLRALLDRCETAEHLLVARGTAAHAIDVRADTGGHDSYGHCPACGESLTTGGPHYCKYSNSAQPVHSVLQPCPTCALLRARLMVVEAEHERLEVEATHHRLEAADARARLGRAEADTVKAVGIGYRDGYEAGWGAASKHGAGYTYATADAAWQASAARHDLLVYRGALGYSVPGDTDDGLSDGTRPVNGLAEAMGWHHEETQRLQSDLMSLRAEVERAARWGYLAGQDAEYDHARGRPSKPFSAAWSRYQQEREGGEGR